MNTPTLFQAAVLVLASGRVSYSLAKDTIFQETRHWVYARSAPHGDTIELTDGTIAPWRMMHPSNEDEGMWDFMPSQPLRTPGFFGQLVECFYCLSFWVSLAMSVAFLVAPDVTTFIAFPFALWGAANLVAKSVHS